MARREKVDRSIENQLDELERKMFVLKIQYEKYFSGVERIEPIRERDEVKAFIRDMILGDPIKSTAQRYRFRQLRARWNVLDLYLQRNLVMIERGTHPKFRFRADLKDRERAQMQAQERQAESARVNQERMRSAQREEAAFRRIYDSYLDARRKCGQSDQLQFDSVQKVLKNQVRNIKARYKCNSVAFRVTIEEGKARLKAVPKV